MSNEYETTQQAFTIIERLAALCATPGITPETQKIANEQIQALLSSTVKTSLTKLGAKSSGLYV